MRGTHSPALVEPPGAGRIIRAFRLRVGFTEEALARALGVSFSTVSRWEHGHMTPSSLAWKALAQLAAEHGCPLPVESSEDPREHRIAAERPPTRASA